MTIDRLRAPGILALAALLLACSTTPGAAQSPSLDGTAWVLTELPGRTLLPKTSVTLQFEQGRVSGSDGCNRFGGGYSAKESALQISAQLAMTMIGCEPAVSEQAQAFVAALQRTRSFRVAEGRLTLLAADAAPQAVLTAQPRALPGTAWEVTGFNNGREAVVSVLTGSRITLEFAADGGASGSAGCNRFTTRYEVDGATLRFAPAAATRRMCVEPEGVMEQEQQFLAALAMVATARFEGERLQLRAPDGALALTLARGEGE